MMLPYAEARAGDVTGARDRLTADGHVVVRGAVRRDLVAAARAAVLSAAAGQGLVARHGDGYQATDARAGGLHGMSLPLWRSEPFHGLAHSAGLLDLAAGILDSDLVLPHPRKVLRFVRAADNRAVTAWHQDWPEVQGTTRTLTMWLPLLPTTGTYGSPQIVGGRLTGPQPMELAASPAGRAAQVPPGRAVHAGPLEPGDVLIFDAFTVHRGGRSQPSGLRLSCDFRYQDAREPICHSSVGLAGWPFAWDDVYRDWRSADLQYYWRQYPLTIVPHSDRFERWRDAEAIRLGRQGDPAARRALDLAARFSPHEHVTAEARQLLADRYG